MLARSHQLLVLTGALALSQRGTAQSVVPSLTLHTEHVGESTVAWRFLVVTDTSEREVAKMKVTTTREILAPGGTMRSAWILRQDVTQRRSGVRFRSVPLS